MSEIRCLLHEMSRMAPNHPGCIEGERMYSFPALHVAAREISQRLRREFGVEAGDRVVVTAPPEWRSVAVVFALLRLGAMYCPLNLRQPEGRLRELGQALRPRLQIAGDRGEPPLPGVPCLRLSQLCEATMIGEQERRPLTLDLEQPASILYTTGSMGPPRAVVHTLEAHYYSALGANRHLPLNQHHRCLLSLPLYHVGGLAVIFRCMLAGAALVLPEPGLDLVENVITHKITVLSMVPTQLFRFLAHPRFAEAKKHLAVVLLGGAPIPRALMRQALERGLPVHATYGMTETASQVCTVGRFASAAQRRETDGEVLPHRQVRVEAGQILVRGHVLACGLWRNGGIEPLPLQDGWYATGDEGRMEDGFLTVTGRRDNQFISGGENIQPEEIERVVMSVLGLEQVVVTPQADAEFGQRPVAWVSADENELQPEMWRERLREFLPGYMLPVAFRSLPPAAGLKPDRKALAETD